jgi:hypothetical protein
MTLTPPNAEARAAVSSVQPLHATTTSMTPALEGLARHSSVRDMTADSL